MENWKRLSHLFVAIFLSNFTSYMIKPAMADVTVEAVCGGREECSLAFYLTGFQQAITGLGAVVMMPLIGNLSDVYGRKRLMLIPLSLAIFPLVILACSRTTNFFYAYYAFRVLTGMVTEGGVGCLASAYLADNVSKEKRTPAFGVLSGVISAADVCGTFAARLVPTSHTFQVAAGMSVAAVAYVAVLLKEMRGDDARANLLQTPILEPETETNQPSKKVSFIRGIASPRDIINFNGVVVVPASFLSEDAPFDFPGFNLLCVGLAYLMGCIMSIWIKLLPERKTMYEAGDLLE